MVKVLISSSALEPGMKMAETIFNEYGSIVIPDGTILDDNLISKLTNLNLEKVRVFKEEKNQPVYVVPDKFKAIYNQDVDVIKELLFQVSENGNIDIIKVNKVVDSVVKNFEEKRDIISYINQIKSADEYTYVHSLNVSLISMLIGKWLKFEREKIELLVQAAMLHDIGKVKVPAEILNKPGKLNAAEYEIIKNHSLYGYRILEKSPDISKEVSISVLMHHEREDGSGYPTGVKGDKIHEFAKIIAVADIYDAMTSKRVYRERESPFEVFLLMEEKTIGELNTKVVSAFLDNLVAYYMGCFVRIDTGEIGEIVYINPRSISRPIIKVNEKYIDLTVEKKIKIVEII